MSYAPAECDCRECGARQASDRLGLALGLIGAAGVLVAALVVWLR